MSAASASCVFSERWLASSLAVNQDTTPQGRPVVDGELRIWARNLSDGTKAVALLNLEYAPQPIELRFAALGWGSERVRVRDLWAHTDNGSATGGLGPITVEPHGTVMLRLSKVVVP